MVRTVYLLNDIKAENLIESTGPILPLILKSITKLVADFVISIKLRVLQLSLNKLINRLIDIIFKLRVQSHDASLIRVGIFFH